MFVTTPWHFGIQKVPKRAKNLGKNYLIGSTLIFHEMRQKRGKIQLCGKLLIFRTLEFQVHHLIYPK